LTLVHAVIALVYGSLGPAVAAHAMADDNHDLSHSLSLHVLAVSCSMKKKTIPVQLKYSAVLYNATLAFSRLHCSRMDES
jgi:hypothetical protein